MAIVRQSLEVCQDTFRMTLRLSGYFRVKRKDTTKETSRAQSKNNNK